MCTLPRYWCIMRGSTQVPKLLVLTPVTYVNNMLHTTKNICTDTYCQYVSLKRMLRIMHSGVIKNTHMVTSCKSFPRSTFPSRPRTIQIVLDIRFWRISVVYLYHPQCSFTGGTTIIAQELREVGKNVIYYMRLFMSYIFALLIPPICVMTCPVVKLKRGVPS